MEDQKADLSEHVASSDKIANQGARSGAQAKGGIAARPGDPTCPAQARVGAAARNRTTAEAGLGDDEGAPNRS